MLNDLEIQSRAQFGDEGYNVAWTENGERKHKMMTNDEHEQLQKALEAHLTN